MYKAEEPLYSAFVRKSNELFPIIVALESFIVRRVAEVGAFITLFEIVAPTEKFSDSLTCICELSVARAILAKAFPEEMPWSSFVFCDLIRIFPPTTSKPPALLIL